MSEERAKRLAQLKAAYESGILDEDTYQSAVAALEGAGHYEAGVESGASAQGPGARAAGKRGVVAGDVGGDIITGDVYYGRPAEDPDEALRIYRRVLFHSSGALPLRGIDIEASDPAAQGKQLGLAQVYVDLDTKTPKTLKIGGGKQAVENRRIRKREDGDDRPLTALEAAAANHRVVLLGDPGGGKSTFVNHLAYCLAARALYPEGGWLDHLPGWPAGEADVLPIVFILRDFAGSLPDPLPVRAKPIHLWTFLEDRLKRQNLDFAAGPIRQILEEGRALVLLDGLDEVPTVEGRLFVRDAVNAFANRYLGNRFLVTCRVLAYQPPEPGKPDLRLEPGNYPQYELALFEEEKIDRFVSAWYGELVRLGNVREQDAQGLVWQLQNAVRRPDLWPLAANPLLLTVMALVHAHKGRLPDARALLYEDTVDMLLWRWEQIKLGGREEDVSLRRALLAVERTEMDLKQVLWRLAYEAHGRAGERDEEGLADIGELELSKALASLGGADWNWARQVIQLMKLRAGLLLERVPGIFSFPHRTFQEYLAGAHLSSQADFSEQASQLVEEDWVAWREVILLAAGRLVYLAGNTDQPLALVAELCPATGTDDPAAWRKAWLAGDVLLEVGRRRAADREFGREMVERVRRRLAPRERAGAGDVLARLGDPRPGVGVRVAGHLSLPDIELCYVPPGPFWMGGGDDDPLASDDEKPLHRLEIPYGYWIGRYPVTVAQFRAYVEGSGTPPEDPDALRDPANRPVRWLSWDEALGFCAWLEKQWRARGWLPANWRVALPSEAEWEKAARGGLFIPKDLMTGWVDGSLTWEREPPLVENSDPMRRYPWGGDPDPERANIDESGIDTTCVAGAFPNGQSPYGLHDLSGNVWEWTRSIWNTDFDYPYDPDDGREDLASRQLRVSRGGAFFVDESLSRCAFRDWDLPDLRINVIGFRVVASPSLPGP